VRRSIVRTALLAALSFPAHGLGQTYGREKFQTPSKSGLDAPATHGSGLDPALRRDRWCFS
jgi:hypothetical protein